MSEAIDKHVATHGTTSDGYLFQGRKYKLVVRRSYQEDFQRATEKAGLPPEFIPHSLRAPAIWRIRVSLSGSMLVSSS